MLSKTFISGLMTCSILMGVNPVFAAEIPASTTWQVSRVTSETQGSYCAMAQKFADKTILTIARNERGDYSFAIEREASKFKKGSSQDITLRPIGGSAQTYVAINQTERTATIGVGANNPIIGQLAKSGKLEVGIDKSVVTYAFANYGKGSDDLDKCISALSVTKDKSADMEKSQLKAVESAAPMVKKDVVKVEASNIGQSNNDKNISAENILAVKPSPMPETQPKDIVLEVKKADIKPVDVNINNEENNDDKLRNELRNTRAQIDILMADKDKLNAVIEKLQKEIDSIQVKDSKDSWDLEQATRRYQESQREIRRLGALLDSNEQKFKKEKKEIEYMLFDPEIAEKAQISMLNNLEDQVRDKDKKISELEKTVSTYKTIPEQEKELAELTQKFKSNEELLLNLRSDIDKKDTELKELKEKLDIAQKELDSKIAQENKQNTDDKTAAEAQKVAMTALNDNLTKSTQKVVELEAKLAEAQSKLDTLNKAVELANTATANAVKDAKDKEAALLIALKEKQEIKIEPKTELKTEEKADIVKTVSQPVIDKNTTVDLVKKSTIFKSEDDLLNILNSAGINVVGKISLASNADDINYRAYSWKTTDLNGSVEMRKLNHNQNMDEVVKAYLSRAKSRCVGEFAAVPSIISGGGTGYEIACVTPKLNSSASVLFSYANNVVTTIAHEGNADKMDVAIDARDKIAFILIKK